MPSTSPARCVPLRREPRQPAQDEALSTPSEREAEHVNEDHARYLRDRHTTLPFAALRTMVARVAGVGRSKAEYDKVTQPVRKHYVELAPGGKLQPIPV